MSFSSKPLGIFSFLAPFIATAVLVHATNVGAPGHPGSNVAVPGKPTPKRTANSPQFFTSEWAITLLSSASGLTPLQVSRDGKIVLLRDSNNPATYYRWSEGSTETLGVGSSLGGGQNYIEKVGTLLINNGNVGLDPTFNSGASYFNAGATMNNVGTIVLNQNLDGAAFGNGGAYTIGSIKLFKPTDSSASLLYTPPLRTISHYDSYFKTTSVHRKQDAVVIQVDDQNKTWFYGEDENEDGTSNTIGQDYSLRVLPVVSHVSRSGHYILETDKFYIDGNPVDFQVSYINDNGTTLAYDGTNGSRFIYYPDGHRDILPVGPFGAYFSLDNQDRVNGWSPLSGPDNTVGIPFLFLKKLGSNGQPVSPVQYEVVSYVPLAFPIDSGWTTNQIVAPGTLAPQIGVAVSASTGQRVPFVAKPNIQLAVDANRDGVISSDGSDETSAENPYRFWINDDNDGSGDDTNGNDIPGSSAPDGQQVKVQGTRDLVDFFPVFLDLKQLLTVLPPSASIKYKLKNADDGLRFVYTDLSRTDAFKYLKDSATGNSLKDADAHWVTAAGYALDATWLGQVKDTDKGVILVEGRSATDKPLVLSVEKADGRVMAEITLQLKIVPVESMFRHLNLHDRNLAGLVGSMSGGTAQPEAMDDPAGFPDNPNSDGRWLIFVHGFNVGGLASRGWNAEMFKRCYWSGQKSRFVGVSWFGNPDDAISVLPADYHLAVRNAMVTATALAQEINALNGTKTIIGHSLGCGVISSAITDHGMIVNKACFVDAALARECFDGEIASGADGMTPNLWKTYDSSLYAANWNKLFPATDARSKLTWRNRFVAANAVIHNFYSSTENVLAEYSGEVPQNVFSLLLTPVDGSFLALSGDFGWVFQEKAKGARDDYADGLTHLGGFYGGWGFNTTDPLDPSDPIYYNTFNNTSGVAGRQPKPSSQIGVPTSDVLHRHPVFDPGWGNSQAGANRLVDQSVVHGPSWIAQLYDNSNGSATAAVPKQRDQLLAEAIPAMTWAVGSHTVQSFQSRNYALTSLVDDWPRALVSGVPEWRHSDMREVAYLYQYRFFDRLVSLSNE